MYLAHTKLFGVAVVGGLVFTAIITFVKLSLRLLDKVNASVKKIPKGVVVGGNVLLLSGAVRSLGLDQHLVSWLELLVEGWKDTNSDLKFYIWTVIGSGIVTLASSVNVVEVVIWMLRLLVVFLVAYIEKMTLYAFSFAAMFSEDFTDAVTHVYDLMQSDASVALLHAFSGNAIAAMIVLSVTPYIGALVYCVLTSFPLAGERNLVDQSQGSG